MFEILSRRRWLKLSLGAGGLFVAGGAGLLALRGVAPAVRGLECLSDQEYRTLSRLARALFPRGGAFPVGAADMDLARTFDRYLADAPPWDRDDLKAAILWLELGPVIYDRRLATFSHLSEADRLAHFERWATSDSATRRQVAVAFRKFFSLVFYDSPEVWSHIGYDGPLLRLDDP